MNVLRQKYASLVADMRLTAPELQRNLLVFGVCILLLGGTQALLWRRPQVGIFLNAVVLLGFSVFALLRKEARKAVIGLSVVPMTTVAVGSLGQKPGFGVLCLYYGVIAGLSRIYMHLFAARRKKRRRANKWQQVQMVSLMIVVGQVVGALGFWVLGSNYPFADTPLPLVFAAVAGFALAEEMLLRGLIQRQGSVYFHPALAAQGAALVGAFLAISGGGALAVPFGLVLHSLVSLVFYYKPNLAYSFALNVAAKFTYVFLIVVFVR